MNRKSFFKSTLGLLAAPLLPLASLAIEDKKDESHIANAGIFYPQSPIMWNPRIGDIVLCHTDLKQYVVIDCRYEIRNKQVELEYASIQPVGAQFYHFEKYINKTNIWKYSPKFTQLPNNFYDESIYKVGKPLNISTHST